MQTNLKASLTKAQFTTPLYSPRTTYSNHLREINSLKTNMIINIDKYILGNLKSQFEKRGKQISMLQFIFFAKKYLKDWNTDLYGREVKMQECLIDVWKEIDIENKGKITWEQFNSKIIETSLNLKSLSNNAGIQAPNFKEFSVPVLPAKYENPIAKLVYIKGKSKMAFFRQQAIQIQFFSTQTISASQLSPQTKPLVLPQQQLKVQTMIKVKQKKELVAGQKPVKQPQKIIKKDLKVSSYKNTIIDSIYLEDQKYDMLIVSSSDKYVRGYNVSNIVPVIAVQPQNQDEQMIHQFPVEIYTMAWDSINEVLYATGKHPKIYQWMIKTDSEREMSDPKGHDKMISTMLMMPKLQLLASGGYDGKLILWDTVGQVIKCKYDQHTRAISSITFHESLILLFTSSFDHKICIWNPYITSLIHKIDNTVNVISIEIIPNTNYLLALDCGGTVKIREVNRFTQVSSFSIFRSEATEDAQSFQKQQKTDKELSISMCSKKDGTIQYYFGTQKIIGYEYFEIEKSSIIGGNISEMKYNELSFKLFTPLKNHVIVWNLLTGRVQQIFYDMSENDITSIQLASQLGFFICGDVDGNIIQRKMNNGFFMKNLGKMKGSIIKMKFHEVQRNEKQKSLKKTYFLFCTTQQGEVNVFKCHPKIQFTLYKQFSIRQDFNITNGNLVSMEYLGQKNILIMKLNTNQVLFIDVQKRSLLIRMEFGETEIVGMNVIDQKDAYYFTILNKSGHITGFYLPPHPKKFKPSCNLQLQGHQKLQYSLYAHKSHLLFVSTEQNEINCYKFQKKYLETDNYVPTLNIEWKTKIQKRVISMILIQNELVLVLLTQNEELIFISVQNGQVICKLKQDIKAEPQMAKEPEPILHFKEKTNQIYIPNQDKIIKIDHEQLESTKFERILDPNFFINFLKNKKIKNFSQTSSGGWALNLNFNRFSESRIKEIQQVEQHLNNGVEKIFEKRGPTQVEKKIQKALELQKKWQRQKDSEGFIHEQVRNQISVSQFERSSKDFKNSIFKNASMSVLWKNKQFPRKSDNSIYKLQKQPSKENDMSMTKSKFSDLQKFDLSKLRSDPLYRLGQALKSVNAKDKKAENFIDLARKKEQLKLPRINSQKKKL